MYCTCTTSSFKFTLHLAYYSPTNYSPFEYFQLFNRSNLRYALFILRLIAIIIYCLYLTALNSSCMQQLIHHAVNDKSTNTISERLSDWTTLPCLGLFGCSCILFCLLWTWVAFVAVGEDCFHFFPTLSSYTLGEKWISGNYVNHTYIKSTPRILHWLIMTIYTIKDLKNKRKTLVSKVFVL